ncbi:MAG TPA: hypothetical protein ENK38_04330 [Gammaproteobacteria bacterium]|nr:hypothetical protein [Gammaproteobacteria bacterium]
MVDKKVDDLTRIKGIGPSRQKWFGEVLGVNSFEQLANLSPDIIESGLKEEGRIISRNTIEEWIAEAAKLADEDRSSSERKKEISKPAIQNNGWHPFASFVVEFQEHRNGNERELRTTVHHMETAEEQTLVHEMEEDTEGKVWPGLENKQLCEWMAERLDIKLRESSEAKQSVRKKTAATATPLHIEINQIRILQPLDSETPIDLGRGGAFRLHPVIKGREPFAVEAIFSVEGPANGSVPSVKYEARFYMENLDTGEERQLDDVCRGVLPRGETSCKVEVELENPSIPPGFYHITTVVTISGKPGRSMGYLRSPQLHVL